MWDSATFLMMQPGSVFRESYPGIRSVGSVSTYIVVFCSLRNSLRMIPSVLVGLRIETGDEDVNPSPDSSGRRDCRLARVRQCEALAATPIAEILHREELSDRHLEDERQQEGGNRPKRSHHRARNAPGPFWHGGLNSAARRAAG